MKHKIAAALLLAHLLFQACESSAQQPPVNPSAEAAEGHFDLGVRHVAEEDHEKAQDCFLKAGEAGDGRGYYGLGLLHEKGLGVPKDDEKACAYFQKSAEMGVGRGYFELGRRHWSASGAKGDAHRAGELYMKAIELGEGIGYVGLGQMSMHLDEPNRTAILIGNADMMDLRRAAQYFKKAGDMGAGTGYVVLAGLHLSNAGRIPVNIDAAIECAQKAVALGERLTGHILLANIYKNTLSQLEKARQHQLMADESTFLTEQVHILRSLTFQKK